MRDEITLKETENYYVKNCVSKSPKTTLKGFLDRMKTFERIYGCKVQEIGMYELQKVLEDHYHRVYQGETLPRYILAALNALSQVLNYYVCSISGSYHNPVPEFLRNYRIDLQNARKHSMDSYGE